MIASTSSQRELGELAAAMEATPELEAFLANPQLDPAAKASVLERVDRGRRAHRPQLRARRRVEGTGGQLRAIAEEFEALVDREQGRLAVELTTAYELADDEATAIVRQIEQASGRTVEATRSVDPDLIGGMILQAGSLRVDASVRGRLNRLRRELVTDEPEAKESTREAPPRRDHLDPEAEDRAVRRRDRPLRGRHRAPGRRRHRARLRPRELRRPRAARVRARRRRHRVQPRGGQRRRRALRRVAARQGGPARPAHRRGHERARRRRAARPRRRSARQPARRPGPDRGDRAPPARVQGAGRHPAAAGERAAPDRASRRSTR